MRWTSTSSPFYRFGVSAALLLALRLLLAPVYAQAQTVPAGQGLVADSTELRVLRAFHLATDGPGWTRRAGWDSLAYWTKLPRNGQLYGVTVQGGDVVDLTIMNNRLRGPLPANLPQLRALHDLRLDENQLTGPIPATWGNFANLHTLEVGFNQLTGPVPARLGRLRELRYLRLNDNQLTAYPDSLGELSRLLSTLR